MRRKNITQPAHDSKATELLRASGSNNREVAVAALAEMAEALTTPLRQGVLSGDILDGIFEVVRLNDNATSEFPLDFLAPGTEKEHVAFTIPNHGYIPERHVEGDYVMVPTYPVGNAIDWNLRYARDARWDVVGRATEVLRSGFTKKMNDDCWQTLITAAFDRNIVVFDSAALAGQFTKRIISLMKTVMRRNGGGNSTSNNRGKLTDIYVSPEAVEDIRNWNVDQVDEQTRREIFTAPGDIALTRIFGVNIHDLDELGEGQEYNNYYLNTLSGAVASGDVEIIVGLDLSTNDSFMMPFRQEIEVYPDDVLHRQQRAGFYSWSEYGCAVLDNRRVLLGSL
jgi:hypothetical protein